jgi:hypothetical protein
MAPPSAIVAPMALARFGLAVFPVVRGRKVPAIKNWQSVATTDPAAVATIFARLPGCNIGAATGSPSGAFVLDIDCKATDGEQTLADLVRRHGPLPDTWAVATPSGGRHLWFSQPGGRRIGNRVGFAPGLDLRGDGGFAVVPPSAIGGAEYRWLRKPCAAGPAEAPEWLLDLAAPLEASIPKRPSTALIFSPRRRMDRSAASALASEIQRVATAAPGGRNLTLFQASANLGELVGAGLLSGRVAIDALEAAAEACGLVRDDGWRAARATIKSGVLRGAAKPRRVAR